MNNKYDVNNFSKLLEEFNLKKEVQAIQDQIEAQIKHLRVTPKEERTNQTIFDPIQPNFSSNPDEYDPKAI